MDISANNLNYLSMFNYEIYTNILKNNFNNYLISNGGLYKKWTDIIKSDVSWNDTSSTNVIVTSFNKYTYVFQKNKDNTPAVFTVKYNNSQNKIHYIFDPDTFTFTMSFNTGMSMSDGYVIVNIQCPNPSTNVFGEFLDFKDICPYTILNICKNNLGDDMDFYTPLLKYTSPAKTKGANSFVTPIKKFNAIGNLSCYVIFSLRNVNNNYDGPCCEISIDGKKTQLFFNKDTKFVDTTLLQNIPASGINIVKIYNQMCTTDLEREYQYATLQDVTINKKQNRNMYYLNWGPNSNLSYNNLLIYDGHKNINNPVFSIVPYIFGLTGATQNFNINFNTDNTILNINSTASNKCISLNYSYNDESVQNSNYTIYLDKSTNLLLSYNTSEETTNLRVSDNTLSGRVGICNNTNIPISSNGLYLTDTSGCTMSELMLFMKDGEVLSTTDFNNISDDCKSVWESNNYTIPDPKCDSIVPYICKQPQYGSNEICGCYNNSSFTNNLDSDLVNTDRICIDANCSSDNAYKSIHTDASTCSSMCTSILDVKTQSYGRVNLNNVQMNSDCTNKANVDSVIFCGSGKYSNDARQCTANETCVQLVDGKTCKTRESIITKTPPCKTEFPVVVVSKDGVSKCVSTQASTSNCQSNDDCNDDGTYCDTEYNKCFPNPPKKILVTLILLFVGIVLVLNLFLFIFRKIKKEHFAISLKNIIITIAIAFFVTSIYYFTRKNVELYSKCIGSNICTQESQICVNSKCLCKIGYTIGKNNNCITLDNSGNKFICNTLSYLPNPIYIGFVLYSTVIDNDIYVFTSNNSVFKWNLESMTWDIQDNYINNYNIFYIYNGQKIPKQKLNKNSFFTYKNKVYIYFNNNISASIYVYDPTLDSSNQQIYNNIKGLTLDNGVIYNDILICVSNNYLYVFGGYDNNYINYNIYVYKLNDLDFNINNPFIIEYTYLKFPTNSNQIFSSDSDNQIYISNIDNDHLFSVFDTSYIENNTLKIISSNKFTLKSTTIQVFSRYYIYKSTKYVVFYYSDYNSAIPVIRIFNIKNTVDTFINIDNFETQTEKNMYRCLFQPPNADPTFGYTYTIGPNSFTINNFFFMVNEVGTIVKLDFTNNIESTTTGLYMNPCIPFGIASINTNYINQGDFITFYSGNNYSGEYLSLPYNANTVYTFGLGCSIPDIDNTIVYMQTIKSIRFGNSIDIPQYIYASKSCVSPGNNQDIDKISSSKVSELEEKYTYIFINPGFLQ